MAVNGHRPVGVLAAELQKRYGYLVTYEEAPYSGQELTSKLRPNGSKFLFPNSSPIIFKVAPDVPGSALQQESTASTRLRSATPDIIQPLLDQHNQSGNPQKFAAIYDGQYTHIVPVSRNLNGRTEAFLPILSTTLTVVSDARGCNEALDDMLDQLRRIRGMNILPGVLPMNNLMSHQCTIQGGRLSARSALSQILGQLIDSRFPADLPRPWYVWALYYDANVEKYFLNITPVFRKANPREAGIGVSPATTTGASVQPAMRLQVPQRFSSGKPPK